MQNLFLLSLTDIGTAIVNGLSRLGIWYHVLYNVIGAIGLIVKIIGLQLKKRSRRIVFNAIQSLCWSTYFILCGNATAGITAPLGILQCFVFYQREKHKWADSYFWIIFFVAIQLGLAIWNISDGISIHDIFPIIAGPFGLVSYFVLNGKVFRGLMIITSICWLLNSMVGTFFALGESNTWMAFICDVLSVSSVIIAILRFDVFIVRVYYRKVKGYVYF
jgi:hypothetical protein